MMSPRRAEKDRRGSEGFSGRRYFFASVLLVLGAGWGCEFQRQTVARAGGGEGISPAWSAEIEEMLHSSSASWNQGDLDGFMDDYWRSEALTFSGADGVRRGWDAVRNRYLESYWAPGVVRDSLDFQDIEVFGLGAEHALALGRYVLYPQSDSGSDPSTGHFTLVLRRMENGWRILHDHTSATPADDGTG